MSCDSIRLPLLLLLFIFFIDLSRDTSKSVKRPFILIETILSIVILYGSEFRLDLVDYFKSELLRIPPQIMHPVNTVRVDSKLAAPSLEDLYRSRVGTPNYARS